MANLKEAVEAGLSALQNLCKDDKDVPFGANPNQWKLYAKNDANSAIEIMKSALESYNTNEVDNPEIALAYLEGKEIEYQDNYSKKWRSYHFDGVTHPMLGHPKYHWRVKPDVNKIVKYKRYLVKYVDDLNEVSGYSIQTLTENDIDVTFIENMLSFVRWIDTEWQEVEV